MAVAIGAIVNTAIQGLSGNINSGGDLFLALGVGALSAAAGYGAGLLVSGALSTATTFGGAMLNGAITGAASGLAGGFVGGAGNAWANGASLGQGFKQGMTGAGLGAATGGLIGGITGGAKFLSMKKRFLAVSSTDGQGKRIKI